MEVKILKMAKINSISYEDHGTEIKVYLAGKKAGEIRKVKTGWQYFPKGSKNGGDVFPSKLEAKRSLET